MPLEPKKGVIALCSRGQRGLITQDEKQEVTYPNGQKDWAYVGIHLTAGREGEPWSSRNPRVLTLVPDYGYEILVSQARNAKLVRDARKK